MHLSIILVFAMKILCVLSRAQKQSDANCICTPFYKCFDEESSSGLHNVVNDRSVITVSQDDEPGECPDVLDICCYNLDPTSATPAIQSPSPSPSLGGVTDQHMLGIGPCGVRNKDGYNITIKGFNDGQSQYGEFPWMVALLTSGGDTGVTYRFVGGGSLIDTMVVLTTAHTVNDANDTLSVRVGEWDFSITSEPIESQNIPVSEIIYHPRYNMEKKIYNYALLILERPAVLGETVGTVCLPSWPGLISDSKECIVSGWGKNVFGEEGRYQRIMKSVTVNMVGYSQCQKALRTTVKLGSDFNLFKGFVCAGDKGQDACTGDGGSPLVCPDPDLPGQYIQKAETL